MTDTAIAEIEAPTDWKKRREKLREQLADAELADTAAATITQSRRACELEIQAANDEFRAAADAIAAKMKVTKDAGKRASLVNELESLADAKDQKVARLAKRAALLQQEEQQFYAGRVHCNCDTIRGELSKCAPPEVLAEREMLGWAADLIDLHVGALGNERDRLAKQITTEESASRPDAHHLSVLEKRHERAAAKVAAIEKITGELRARAQAINSKLMHD
jgi:hypothetical protein